MLHKGCIAERLEPTGQHRAVFNSCGLQLRIRHHTVTFVGGFICRTGGSQSKKRGGKAQGGREGGPEKTLMMFILSGYGNGDTKTTMKIRRNIL